jgi:hypothetical protein
MFVYGIRCAPADLKELPSDAIADYYLDYGLLVFPTYTRPSCVRGALTPEFWDRVRRIASNRVHSVEFEHPYITDEENDVVRALKYLYPLSGPDWYYVPVAASSQESDLDQAYC